jgi:hypothetical protein
LTEVSFVKKSQRLTEMFITLVKIIKINWLALYFQDKGKGVVYLDWILNLMNVRYRLKTFEV